MDENKETQYSKSKERMKIVSWNCIGQEGNKKLEVIKRIKTIDSTTNFLLQETKMDEVDIRKVMSRIWANGEGK